MTIAEETSARITTQLALRHTANLVNTTHERVRAMMSNKAKKLKNTRSNLARFNEECIDHELDGALIYKTSFQEKNIKHKKVQWVYLEYDANKPFTRREEHIIPIVSSVLLTRKPNDLHMFSYETYVSKHFLERVAMRRKVSTLEEITASLIEPLLVIMMEKKIVRSMNKDDGLVYITKDEYIILDGFGESEEESKILIKTYIPSSEWSNKQKEKIQPVLDAMAKDRNYSCLISQDDFNSKNILSCTDIKAANLKTSIITDK